MRTPTLFIHTTILAILLLGQRISGAVEATNAAVKTAPETNAAPERVMDPVRLKWNLKTAVGDYDRIGRKNPEWDADAREALRIYAEIVADPRNTTDEQIKQLGKAAASAVDSGCDDPLVRYVHLRYRVSSPDRASQTIAKKYVTVAKNLDASEYGANRKLIAKIRAATALATAFDYFYTNPPPDGVELLQSAANDLKAMAVDTNVPEADLVFVVDGLVDAGQHHYSEVIGKLYPEVLNGILRKWTNHAELWLQKGIFYTAYAWKARGGGWANSVNEKGWKEFGDRIRESERALLKAWEQNPKDKRIPKEAITIELAIGEDRADMEMWFDRAMELDPNYYDACYAKLWYLDPRWHGSAREMIAFGKECVKSTKWGGSVPLILTDAHQAVANYYSVHDEKEAAAEYLKRPEVWRDMKQSYERFFALNPEETGYRHNYARHASRCGQWEALSQQLKLMGYTNYQYFGGEAAFQKMLVEMNEHLEKPAALEAASGK